MDTEELIELYRKRAKNYNWTANLLLPGRLPGMAAEKGSGPFVAIATGRHYRR